MEMGVRVDLERKYFDDYKDAEALNQQLTEQDKIQRPELYEMEGSTWCKPQWDDEQGKWWVLVPVADH